jgi:hypothetical protein
MGIDLIAVVSLEPNIIFELERRSFDCNVDVCKWLLERLEIDDDIHDDWYYDAEFHLDRSDSEPDSDSESKSGRSRPRPTVTKALITSFQVKFVAGYDWTKLKSTDPGRRVYYDLLPHTIETPEDARSVSAALLEDYGDDADLASFSLHSITCRCDFASYRSRYYLDHLCNNAPRLTRLGVYFDISIRLDLK